MKPKRLISLLVAVCMMVALLPVSAVTAFAADTSSSTEYDEAIVDGYKYKYKVNGGNATITKFLGPVKPTNYDYDIDIPETLDDKYTVTAIGNYAFYSDLQLGEVTIPQSVTSIGDSAFGECFHLKKLSFGEKSFGENIETNIQTIGNSAFNRCIELESVTIPQSVTSIGDSAFAGCISLTTLSLGENIKRIGQFAFADCSSLTNVTIPQSVTSIGNFAFRYCTLLKNVTIPEKVTTIGFGTFFFCNQLESITLPAGLTSFQDNLTGCPADCVIYYNNDEAHAHDLFGDKLAGRKFLCLCNVTFDANGGTLTDSAEVPVYKTEKITDTKANELTAINDPTRAGYKFTGWYTEDGQPFDVNETAITEDITLHAGWEFDPNAPGCHPLTVTGGTATVEKDGQSLVIDPVVTGNKKTYSVPEGATVTVTLDKTLIPEGMVFDIWSTGKFSLPLGQDYKAESITFTMNTMSSDADIAAQYRDATIEDDGPDVLGTVAIIGTAAVGGAVLGYQAYSLGTEFAGKLMALPYFPSNRSALAMMLWEDVGKPMPESELLYPDVEQEERDMDLQHAARWAMENELIPDLNDEGTAPEEMKFFPANPVSKLDVLNAWQKAQELKNN